MFKINNITLAILLFASNTSYADDDNYSFDNSVLFGNEHVDLNVYNIKNYVKPGEYWVDLQVNQQSIGSYYAKFIDTGLKKSAQLCVDRRLVDNLDLKSNIKDKLPSSNCISIKDIDPRASYLFDKSNLVLKISLPQYLTVDRTQGYIDPKLFEQGINSSFIGYSANINHNNLDTEKYLSLSSGVNFDGWFFRHNGYFESSEIKDFNHYRSNLNALYRDINAIKSRISLGQFYTEGNNTESLPIIGAQLAFDQNMLPEVYRNYAPNVEGIANTNAIVRIYQNGNKIYEKSVSAGPFKLTDFSTLSSGDLTVEIDENNGGKRYIKIPLQNSINLIRKGQLRYSISTGRYNLTNHLSNEDVAQLSLSYGLINNLTLTSGITYSTLYRNYSIGSALNTPLGGFSFSNEQSQATIKNSNQTGQQYKTGWQYYIQPENLSLSAHANFASAHFKTASNTFSILNYKHLDSSEIFNFLTTNNLKSQYGLTVAKAFDQANWGSFSMSFLDNKYRGDSNSYFQYNASYSNAWNKLSYTLGITQTSYSNHVRKDRNFYLSLSMPLNWNDTDLYLQSSMTHYNSPVSSTDSTVGISGTTGDNKNINFGLDVSNHYSKKYKDDAINGNISYRLPEVNLSASVYHNQYSTQYATSAQGAFVLHRYGITATNTIPSTYTIVHVLGGDGASLVNGWGITLDRFGNAIYNNSIPYSRNNISIDPEKLPITSSLLSNKAVVIPRQFSSTLVDFKVKKTTNILLRLRNKSNNLNIPIGSSVINMHNETVGMVGQSNQILLDQYVAETDSRLTIHWGENNKKSCQLDVPSASEKSIIKSPLTILNIECK